MEQSLERNLHWTILSTLLLSMFARARVAIVSSHGDEIPIDALRTGDTMKKTVWLDCRKILSFYNWVVAWKKERSLFGSCMAFALINTIVLVPLAAHLFLTITLSFTATTVMPQIGACNDLNFVELINCQPIISMVPAAGVWWQSAAWDERHICNVSLRRPFGQVRVDANA